MDRQQQAQEQYEAETGFSSDQDEARYIKAFNRYKAKRTAYHLAHPESADIDVMAYEKGQMVVFIKKYADNPEGAAHSLYAEVLKAAEQVAQNEADDADYDTIMECN